jgi:hypothetical protein
VYNKPAAMINITPTAKMIYGDLPFISSFLFDELGDYFYTPQCA